MIFIFSIEFVFIIFFGVKVFVTIYISAVREWARKYMNLKSEVKFVTYDSSLVMYYLFTAAYLL